MGSARRWLVERYAAPLAWLRAHRAAVLAALLLLAGWAFLTWGVASLLVWQVWPISAGLLALSLFGWGFLATIAREGLYTLTRPTEPHG